MKQTPSANAQLCESQCGIHTVKTGESPNSPTPNCIGKAETLNLETGRDARNLESFRRRLYEMMYEITAG